MLKAIESNTMAIGQGLAIGIKDAIELDNRAIVSTDLNNCPNLCSHGPIPQSPRAARRNHSIGAIDEQTFNTRQF
ncbi:hypothetical protein [Microcoleus sp. bin38.metabat.b11b12b14.051]|uniref:hypothetical protein n=1 Tax=Microcoleus sp. bin38.metabat.b11b12b14.051 TaxID=2742709 RepID=UPI0025FBC041|nr:hypothetical protein [Microcoleus sp. bin38.metabat.b11b12b14.051]